MARDQTVWFAVIDGREAGPMTRGEFALRMASDLVDEGTFVWKEGMAEWLPAARVGELAPMFKTRVQAKQRMVRPPPPPAAALAKANAAPPIVAPPIEEEIELDIPPTNPPAAEKDVQASNPPAAAARLDDEAPVRTIVEMLPFGELIHQQQVAKSLFTSGEFSGASTGKTGKFALDDLKWKYAPTRKAPSPQDAKAAALARAIQATSVRPAEPIVQPPVTPAHAKTPPAGPRPRKRPSAKRAPVESRIRGPRAFVVAVGFGAGLVVVLASALMIWLWR